MNFSIGKFAIGKGRVFVIAEIGNNHNGDFQRAINLIDLAIESGADCVKFQMRHLDHVYREKTLKKTGEDLGTEYILDLLNRFELSVSQHKELAKYCASKNILYLCTPWDVASIEVLESIGVLAYKVASADLTNLPLLEKLILTKKPLIISTGMTYESEIKISIDYLNSNNADYVLLHCNSTYPAPVNDINLLFMKRLQKMHPLVGYSGHERGINISLASIALGAVVIERHFTLDRNMEGPDHAASLEPNDFNLLVQGIREIESALGSEKSRVMSQGEMINRENLSKSLVATKNIKKGEILNESHIMVRSPGQGLSPQFYLSLLGKTINRDVTKEDFFYRSDIEDIYVKPESYFFSRPWGVPVRYHDFNKFNNLVKPDLFEFHLSYSDMDLDPANFLNGIYESDFVVHAPELFSESKLMDLAADNYELRKFSIIETQRVIEITKKLKIFFPSTEKPLIVANIGGFSMDKEFSISKINDCYERFGESLAELDLNEVELIPQTMAPFPWHFGGQRYQNLFLRIDEIIKWCEKLKLRMCFDVSHSKLACNYLDLDFYAFSEQIAPYVSHIHIGDAKGLNGEGLQIGSGEIDFERLSDILKVGCPKASFIPEIWQGHKNDGEGFWMALNKLNNRL